MFRITILGFSLLLLSVCGPKNTAEKANATVQSSLISVWVTPAAVDVFSGGSTTFGATVSGTADQVVTWSVVEESGGSISPGGKYSAPLTLGTYHVTAASHADPSQITTATITVLPGETLEMADIPAGCFDMGDAMGEGSNHEFPLHQVCLDAYEIDIKEVSNAQYAICVAAGGCTAPDSNDSFTHMPYYSDAAYDSFPVINVDWAQADAYCTWASKRLPTEAEWEYAARGGLAGKRFPWGDTINCSQSNYRHGESCLEDLTPCEDFAYDIEDDAVNYCVGDTVAGGSYPANGYGIFDMAGNLAEWLADWYAADYYAGRPNPDHAPAGPTSGTFRVVRGSGFGNDAFTNRVSYRNSAFPLGNYSLVIGFRCVR